MSNGRHSYIAFYPSDWMAGTMRMTRLVRSVYHDVCLYNWDKNARVPEAEIMLMLADLEGQGEKIVDALVRAGKLLRDDDGAVWSERAMLESERAFALWEKKSRGGKITQSKKSAGETPAIEPEPEPEPLKKEGGKPPLAKRAPKKRPSGEDCRNLANAWNAMALKAGLAQIIKLTPSREASARVRLEEMGMEKLVEALALVPQRPFLMGRNDTKWQADFDWFIRPNSAAKVLEGSAYMGTDQGKPSGWRE